MKYLIQLFKSICQKNITEDPVYIDLSIKRYKLISNLRWSEEILYRSLPK